MFFGSREKVQSSRLCHAVFRLYSMVLGQRTQRLSEVFQMNDIFDLKNLSDIPKNIRQQLTCERIWNQEKLLHDAITMREQGYTYKQIALHLGCSKQNIHKRIKRMEVI